MSKVFVVDVSKCTGCYNCQLVCKDEHCGNDWMPYAKPQPMTGHFWAKMEQKTCGSVPKVKIHYTPTFCNHCQKAPCIAAAKDGAVYRRDDGLVIIDPEKAVGQKQLIDACPYGAIYWNEEENVAQKCTGCAHLLDHGAKLPRCVEACPTDALMFGEEEDLADWIAGATVIRPELGCFPRVYYRNVPGQFVAGLLYDPVSEEIVEGAKCRLTNGGKTWFAVSDDFGDFWFMDLPVGKYDLVIEARGYAIKTVSNIDASECVNLGELALERAQA